MIFLDPFTNVVMASNGGIDRAAYASSYLSATLNNILFIVGIVLAVLFLIAVNKSKSLDVYKQMEGKINMRDILVGILGLLIVWGFFRIGIQLFVALQDKMFV